MAGWVKIHRDIQKSPMWLSEPFTRSQAWIDLLLSANHKRGYVRKRGIIVTVERGQVGESEETLADRWKWSRGKLRRFLNELISVQQISREPVQQNKFISSLITITNYHDYQKDDTAEEQGNDTTTSTTNGQQIVQQTDSKRYSTKKNKNEKNEKNEKKKPSGPCPWPDDFVLTDHLRELASKHIPADKIELEWEAFKARCLSKDEKYVNWEKAWTTRYINYAKFNASNTNTAKPTHPTQRRILTPEDVC
jgi:hypothetical protein